MNGKLSVVISLALAVAGATGGAASVVEEHVAGIIADCLMAAERLRAADPAAVPMAFWDFDGTIIKGDIGLGFRENGEERYPSLIMESIRAGFSTAYKGESGARRWRDVDFPHMASLGKWLPQEFDAQMYAGVVASELDAFCARRIREVRYDRWYFASSMAIWKALAEAGIENYVVSADVEALVRNVAPTLGISRDCIHGARVENVGGRWSTNLVGPIPCGDGKASVVRKIVEVRPHGFAMAGFGNSYPTDGAFLRHILQQQLPGNAKPVSVMINGGEAPPEFKGIFRCVKQEEIVGL